jgi:hypothetical protein
LKAEGPDPLEPEALRAGVESLAGGMGAAPPTSDRLCLRLQAGNRERRGLAAVAATLSPTWRLEMLVAGSDRDDAAALLGSTRVRGGWTGRLIRGVLRHRSPWLDLDLGRERAGDWTEGPAPLALGLEAPPLDQARVALKLPRLGLRLETRAAELPTPDHAAGFRRWLGGHRLVWERGTWRLCVGDLVVYTGWRRGLEPAYLNPFLPTFIANFEGVAEADTLARHDNDNNLLLGEARWCGRVGELGLVLMAEAVVDEYQLDEGDRRAMSDVVGLRLLSACTWERPAGTWQAALGACRLSTWLYQHPGLQTNWSVRGQGMGHPDGGDLLEMRGHLAWLAPRCPEGRLGELTGLRVEGGLQRKGAVELADVWDPAAAGRQSPPSPPVRRRAWCAALGQVEWRLTPILSLEGFALWQGAFGEAAGWRRHDLEAGLRLHAALDGKDGE